MIYQDMLFFSELGGNLQAHELFDKSSPRGQSLRKVWDGVLVAVSLNLQVSPPSTLQLCSAAAHHTADCTLQLKRVPGKVLGKGKRTVSVGSSSGPVPLCSCLQHLPLPARRLIWHQCQFMCKVETELSALSSSQNWSLLQSPPL